PFPPPVAYSVCYRMRKTSASPVPPPSRMSMIASRCRTDTIICKAGTTPCIGRRLVIYEVPLIEAGERSALARIDELRRQLRFYAAEPRRWVGSVRRVLAARAIQGSNSIEGYNVSIEDAVAAIGEAA